MILTPAVLFDRHLTDRRHIPSPTPTRDDRYVAFRQNYREATGNAHPWKCLQKYDPDPVSPDEIAEAYDFKYGR